MLSDRGKREISFGVFMFGIFGGLLACGASLRAVFTIGANDTLPFVIALLLTTGTPMFICFIALWYRKFAGWWLVITGIYFPLGLAHEIWFSRAGSEDTTLLQYIAMCLIVIVPLFAVGVFAILTDRAGWPRLLNAGPPRGPERHPGRWD